MVDGGLTGVGEEVPDQGMIAFERHMNRNGKGEHPLKQEAASAMLCHFPDCPHHRVNAREHTVALVPPTRLIQKASLVALSPARSEGKVSRHKKRRWLGA